MPQSFASLQYHVIFSTKSREPLLDLALQPRLFEYMGGILRNHNGVLLAAGGMPDHVHLLMALHREMAVAEGVKLVKAYSSGWIHETFPELRVCLAGGVRRIHGQLLEHERREALHCQPRGTSSPADLQGGIHRNPCARPDPV